MFKSQDKDETFVKMLVICGFYMVKTLYAELKSAQILQKTNYVVTL